MGKKKQITEPWIPAPGRTSIRNKLKDKLHQSQSSTIAPYPSVANSLRKSIKGEEEVNEKLDEYENKIEDLITQVAMLQNQSEINKSVQEIQEKDTEIEALKSAVEEKEQKLIEVMKERNKSEEENEKLRSSFNELRLKTSSNRISPTPQENLLHNLVEAEVNGMEISKLMTSYCDVISRIQTNKNDSDDAKLRFDLDLEIMEKTKRLLQDKMSDYDRTNKHLRIQLQSHYKDKSNINRLENDKNGYRDQLTTVEASMIRMRTELEEKNVYLDRLLAEVEENKRNLHSLNELNKSIETTRAHLQRELRSRDMEISRLHIQIRKIEDNTAGLQEEAKDQTKKMKIEREKISKEKEEVKKAARISRNRVEKIEEKLCSMRCKMAEKEKVYQENISEIKVLQEKYKNACEDKIKLEDKFDETSKKLNEIQINSIANKQIDENKINELNHQIELLKAEKDRASSDSEELKNTKLELEEIKQELRRKNIECKDNEDELIKNKLELEQVMRSLERLERSSQRMREEGSDEIERVKNEMLEKLKQLQPLPQILKETELKLRDAEDRLQLYEEKNLEKNRLIDTLTNKVEDDLDETQQTNLKLSQLTNEKRALDAQLQLVSCELQDKNNKVKYGEKELFEKDEIITNLEVKLSSAFKERDSYRRQLDSAFQEFRNKIENEKDKSLTRENALQSKLISLESDLTRVKSENLEIKRSKDDAVRKWQMRFDDVREQLDQSEKSITSMRSYVDFLKSSYNQVFTK